MRNVDNGRVASELARLLSDRFGVDDARRIGERMENEEAYQDEFIAASRTLLHASQLAADEDIQALLAQKTVVAAQQKQRKTWAWLAMAASLLLAVVVAVQPFFVPDQTAVEGLRYITRIGEQKTVDLPDGSSLTLNTGTELLVKQNDRERRVILKRGEAFFDIVQDSQRPFTVELGEQAVTVLGTQFDIHKRSQQFTVAVVEGVVAIHKNNEAASTDAPLFGAPRGERVEMRASGQYRVQAGWIAEYQNSNGKLSGYQPKNMDYLHSWRKGFIQFSEQPLYKLVNELNRYSAKKILIEDSSIMELEVHAGVRVDQIDQALKGLEMTLPIKVISEFDRIVIVGKKAL